MTEVEFHTGVVDPVGFACRLLRKASRQGVRVLVTAPDEVLGRLDRELWTFEQGSFLPHVRVPGEREALAKRTPVWLATDAAVPAAPGVVINLGADAPSELHAVQRLIEVVSADPDDTARGRSRWRAYAAAGLRIRHHAAGSERE